MRLTALIVGDVTPVPRSYGVVVLIKEIKAGFNEQKIKKRQKKADWAELSLASVTPGPAQPTSPYPGGPASTYLGPADMPLTRLGHNRFIPGRPVSRPVRHPRLRDQVGIPRIDISHSGIASSRDPPRPISAAHPHGPAFPPRQDDIQHPGRTPSKADILLPGSTPGQLLHRVTPSHH